MISVFLLLITIFSAYLVVIAGGIAYELTGLDRSTAHFQALSAFTGTGFTTRAAERVVNHPVRRQITIVMIVLGYAGTATVVASLVTSVDQGTAGASAMNLGILALVGFVAWRIIRKVGVVKLLADPLRRLIAARLREEVPHEELLIYKPGFGITRIEVPPRSRMLGLTLRESNLREHQLAVLAVEVNNEVVPLPEPDWTFTEGCHVVLYGSVDSVATAFGPADEG